MKIAKIENGKIHRIATVPPHLAQQLYAVHGYPQNMYFNKNSTFIQYILCDSYIPTEEVLDKVLPDYIDNSKALNEINSVWKESLHSPFTVLRRFL